MTSLTVNTYPWLFFPFSREPMNLPGGWIETRPPPPPRPNSVNLLRLKVNTVPRVSFICRKNTSHALHSHS